ncbi:WD40 repeat domain-containing protein [Nostoc sp. FACHB-892]|uniref:nSTAND1 domain-containing NTPase n=1 Tax=Nostoc sp. FACHB-892 TaxID=2692843 RepID=UPI0016890A5E|nr:WD40 repeat domain-containing protein [Nostoc sp. FACHB-892]
MSEQPDINQTIKETEYAATSAAGDAIITITNYYYGEDVRLKPVESVDASPDQDIPCPYRGLFHFSPDDAKFFFGRELFVEELFQATKTHHFIPVLGASGSGKSSVVLAGLVPKLQKEGHWKFTHFRPGSDPFHALALALVPLYTLNLDATDQIAQARKLAGYLCDATLPLSDVFAQIKQNHPNDRVLLIGDQFEELYTLCNDEVIRRNFLDKLLTSFQSPTNNSSFATVLVATMRADFLGNALSYRPFADMLQNSDIKLGAMNREELSRVIEEPSKKLKVTFETGLVGRILDDVEDAPGNLPLLQFALTELWKRRIGRRLTHAAYDELGQVKGALASYADEEYGKLSATEQKQARCIFIQLVRPGEGTEDTRRLATKAELGEASWTLVKQLADARLIVTSHNAVNQETVEVVHEALIRNWGELRQWMVTDRDFRAWQERLRAAMTQWEKANWDESVLLRGVPLGEAKEKLKEHREKLSQTEQDYIEKSLAFDASLLKQKEKRRQRQMMTASITSIIFAGFAVFAGYQWRQAEINQIRAFRESSEAFLVSNQDLDALINSLQAGIKLNQPLLQVFPFEAELKNKVKVTLQQAVYQVKEWNRLQVGQQDVVNSVTASFSPNGQLLATGGDDGTVGLWNLQGQKLKSWQGNKGLVLSLSFSPNGQLLATVGDQGAAGGHINVTLWNLQGQQLKSWQANQGWIRTISFTPDGQGLVTGGQDGKIHLRNLQGQQLKTWQAHNGWIWKVTFSPDGQRLATAGYDNVARIWDLQGNKLAELKGHTDPVRSVSFSPDGQQLATTGDDGTIRLWNLQGKQLKVWRGNFQGIWSISFSPDGQFLVTGGEGGNAHLWDLKGQKVGTLKGYQGPVRTVNFSPNGQLLATAGDGNTVRLWNFQGQQLVKLKGHQGDVIGFSFNPNAKQLVTSGQDGTIRLWDLQSQQVQVLPGHQGMVTSIRFSPNGQQLASIGDKGMIYLWDLQGRLLKAWQGHQGIRIIKFSPNGQQLLSTDNNMIRLWDLQGQQLKAWQGTQNENIKSVSFSPDGKRLATTGDAGNVYLWDLQSQKLQTLRGHPNGTQSVSFHPDGQRLATAGDDGTVRLWNLQGTQLAVFTVEQSPVWSVSFSPNGQQFVTIGDEGVARLWDLQGRQLAVFTASFKNLKIIAAFFSPNERQLATIEDDGTVKLWQIESSEDLIKRSCNWVRDYLKNNPEVEKSNKHLCNGIGTGK